MALIDETKKMVKRTLKGQLIKSMDAADPDGEWVFKDLPSFPPARKATLESALDALLSDYLSDVQAVNSAADMAELKTVVQGIITAKGSSWDQFKNMLGQGFEIS